MKHWEWVELKYGDKRSAAEKREGNKLLRKLKAAKVAIATKKEAEAQADAEKVVRGKFPVSQR